MHTQYMSSRDDSIRYMYIVCVLFMQPFLWFNHHTKLERSRMLRGKLCVIRPLEWEDLEQLHHWYQDQEVMLWASGAHPDVFFSRYDLEERFEKEAKNEKTRRFMVETHGGIPMGTVTYRNMNHQLHSAILGITIGNKDYWGKGYGTDIIWTFMAYLFDQWNLNRLELDTWSGNQRAIHTYEKCGFQIEGCLRDGYYVNGQYHDKVIMGILKRDFDQMKENGFSI